MPYKPSRPAGGAFRAGWFYQANELIQQGGSLYSRNTPGVSGASFAADVANWTPLGATLAQRATRVASFGQSYAADVGDSTAMQGWSNKLARALGAEHVHYGHSGAVGSLDDGSTAPNEPGGFSTVLNGLRPNTVPGSVRVAAPYLPMSDVVALDFGANDMWAANATPATSAAMVRNTLRAMICRARAGGVFEDSDASVVYAGTWVTSGNGQASSGGSLRSCTVAGGTVTITVPADFPGGEIDLGFLYYNGGQAVWGIVVDGGASQPFDTTALPVSPNAGKFTHGVYRITGLAPGAHTIVATCASVAAGAGWFDYWQIVSPLLPTVVVINQPHHQIAGGWVTSGTAGFLHSPVVNADFDLLNAQLAALVAEFDSYVVLADIASAFGASPPANGQPLSPFYTDNLHPNDRGHTIIAQTALAALRGASYNPATVPARPHWRLVGPIGGAVYPNGTEPGLTAGWSALGFGFGGPTGAMFCKDASGNVHIRAGLKAAAQPPTNTTIFTLPEGYWPHDNIELPVVAGNGATIGSIEVDATGNVIWQAGTVTAALVIEASFPCDE